MLRRHERTLQRKNFNSVLLQPRWPTKQQYNILARKHACAYYDINAAGTACWRSAFESRKSETQAQLKSCREDPARKWSQESI